MNPRGRATSGALTGSPILVGSVTVLVAIVTVFLAYNANTGLPFVPTTTLYIESPDGSAVTKGNDVRRGGFRVGSVTDLQTRRVGGRTVARIQVKLDKAHGDLPVDTRFVIRSRSLLGIKYVDIVGGKSKKTFRDSATVPAEQTTVPVQIDDVTSTFDKRTRQAIPKVLGGLGDGFAGRGTDLNEFFAELPPLLPRLERVTHTLAEPSTELPRFIRAIDRTVTVLAPVAREQAHLFSVAATTFAAFVRDPDALRDSISEGAETLRVATPELRRSRPFLEHAAALGPTLESSSRELRAAIPDLDRAVVAGTPVSRRTPAFADRLDGTFQAVSRVALDPSTGRALRGVTATIVTLNPQLRYLGPFITVCNYWNFFWTIVADTTSIRNDVGQSFRVISAVAPNQQDGYGSQGAKRQANGVGAPPGMPAAYLHGQPGGAAINDDGSADCEAAGRGYPSRLASFAAPDLNVTQDSHTPGSQGPVFESLDDVGKDDRKLGNPGVPGGQTYTRSPETGPRVPFQPEGGR